MARKLRQTTFELPCGYLDEQGEAHKSMTVFELDHGTDKAMATSMSSSELLAKHTVAVGPVKDAETIQEAVAGLEKGDFDWALIQIRILSLGATYEYPMICPSKTCKFEGTYEYDLEEIDVIDMPDPKVRTFTYGTDDGMELVFRTLKARDMEDLADLMDDHEDQITKVLALQLVSIDGNTPVSELKKKGRKCKNAGQHVREATRMMDTAEIAHREKEEIRKGLRGIRGYPNRRVRQSCPECGTNFSHLIPIDYSFIAPSLGAAIQHGTL